MTYNDLLKKYRSGEVFIYGRSVVQIVDMATRCDTDDMKTDFIYHTERNRRGIITVSNEERVC